MRNNHTLKGKYRAAFVLLILFLIVQCESIKFGRKSTEKKLPQTTKQVPVPKVDNQHKEQQNPPKTTQQPMKVVPQLTKQPQRPKQITPQVIPVPTTTQESKPKQIPKKLNDKSLDSLFGQSTESKSKQNVPVPSSAPVMKITPEEHTGTTKTPVTSQSTVTSTQPQQKKSQANSMIGGLFGEQKGEKLTKTSDSSNKQNKPAETQTKGTESTKQPVKSSVQIKTQTPQTQVKDQNTVQKQKKVDKQQVKTQNLKQQKQQKAQEQSSGDVYYPASKKPTKKENQPQQKEQKVQTLNKDNNQDEVDQKIHKQNSKEEQSQSQQIIYPKKSKSSKHSSKSTPNSQQQNPEDAKQKYSLTLFFTFSLYSLIIVLVIITIKCTSSSTKVVKAVGIMVDAVGDIFKKKQGYRPALNEEEITEREEEITVGYNVEDNNKQIFWEKNSVEGI